MEEEQGKAPLLLNKSKKSKKSTTKYRCCCCCLQWKWWSALVSGPMLACLVYVGIARVAHVRGYSTRMAPMAASLAWVFAWWVAEPVPVPITSLLPLVLLPTLGVRSAAETSASYANDTIFLILASSFLAVAVEKHSAHRRLALHMVRAFGGPTMRPRRLLLGFCLSSFLTSALIDNAPAATMLVPLVFEVAKSLHTNDAPCHQTGKVVHDANGVDFEHKQAFVKALLLGTIYGVSIGGIVTLTGNGANLALSSLWATHFPSADGIGYLEWLSFGFPYGMVVILGTWGILCLSFIPTSSLHTISSSLKELSINQSIMELGPVTLAEKSIFTLFLVLLVLLLTRTSIGSFPGWNGIFNGYVENGTTTVLVASFLFALPNGKEGKKLMDWSDCRDISWGTILLIGGGLALADGFTSSGLDTMVSDYLEFMDSISFLFITPIIGIVTSIVTEFIANIAVATMFVPVVVQIALATNTHPLVLLMATTIGAQTSFILPVGNIPNAIAYATGLLETKDVLKPGLAVKMVALVWLSVLIPTLGVRVFNNNV